MNKLAIVGASATAVLLMVPLAFASASTISNVEYANGDVTTQGTAGQSITGKVRVVVGSGEVVERMQFDVISDSLAPVCVEVGGEKGLEEGTHFVNIPSDVKYPPNTGTYSLAVQNSGIFGAFKTVDCTSNVNGSASFGGSVKTVGTGTGTGTSTPAPSPIFGSDDFWAKFAAIIAAAFKANAPAPAPAKDCPPVHNGYNTGSVQNWLVNHGFMTQAQVNTGPGIFGPKTTAAYGAAMASCK